MLKIFHRFAILLLLQVTNNEDISRIITTIVEKGTNAIVECNNSYNFDSLLWSYKPPNGAYYEDLIVVGSASIRNKISGRRDQWFNVTNDTNCRSSLFLPKIQFEGAGVYACWEGLMAKGVTNVIVVYQNNCSITPEFPDSENIILGQNDSVTIKCSFQYSADKSCIVTPIWTDLTGHRNLTIPDDDFEVNMDDKHAWIHLKHGVKIINGTQFNLSFAFNCSFANISFKNQGGQRGCYGFGIAPFKLFFDGSTSTELNYQKMDAFNILLTVAVNIAIAIVVSVLLFLVCLKRFSKLCFANNDDRRNIGATARISDGYAGIRKDLSSEDTNTYEVIPDGHYESITGDPPQSVCVGSHFPIVE